MTFQQARPVGSPAAPQCNVGKEQSMDCVNHSGVTATAYCQNCGKALCEACVRKGRADRFSASRAGWRGRACRQPYVAPPPGAPSPGLAAVLGIIPGVGAMYNGQFIKGMVHVVIFAVLVSAAHVYGVFGLFIAAWIFYQVFEAYHTAKARRDGDPLPDPLGLNEISNMVCRGQDGVNRARSRHSQDRGRRVRIRRQIRQRIRRAAKDLIRRRIRLRIKLRIRVRIKARIKIRIRRPPPGLPAREFHRFRRCRPCRRCIGGAGSRSAP